MNCDQARELLMDLVYGELEGQGQATLQEHLRSCAPCRDELARLRQARAALAKARAGEPADAPVLGVPCFHAKRGSMLLGKTFRSMAPGPRVIRARWWVSAGAATAAIVVLAVGIWYFNQTGEPVAMAANLKPEIKRVGVSLTILSQPEGWAMGPAIQDLANNSYQQEAAVSQRDRQMPNASFDYDFSPVIWTGLALVRDQRLARNLQKGATQVRFTDVPTAILPESVRLRALDAPNSLTILEQNYQYDLASSASVLRKYVDKEVVVVFKDSSRVGPNVLFDGPSLKGTLLSFDEANLVVRPTVPYNARVPVPPGPRTIARSQVKAIGFEKLPEGLLTRPTLVWQLRSAAQGQQQFEVAYLTRNLMWRADYVLKFHPSSPPVPGPKSPVPLLDSADLVGYATVSNGSGVTYEQAQLKLLAGDVNIIRPQVSYSYQRQGGWQGGQGEADRKRGFQEKSFFEYHLYTLERPTTLRDRETKQIEMVTGSGLKLRRTYVYDPDQNATAARVVSELVNSKANGLGVPLPKGVVRLYAPDPEGVDTYVSETTIDHTPKDEKLRLPWGYAFDIACRRTVVDHKVRGSWQSNRVQHALRNHKDHDVTVTAIVHVDPSTFKFDCVRPWHIRQVGWIEIDVPIKANSQEKVDFYYEFNTASGGGLKEPASQKS